MVWTGYARAQAVPMRLRGAPDHCLAYRRVIKDLDDGDEILDDTFAILCAGEHLARKLCEEPREVRITMFFCDHPQYIVADGTDVATPGAGVRMSRTKPNATLVCDDCSLILVVATTLFRPRLC
jgi:hypothetical protein